MYRQIVHFLQGQVLVRIECGCPERMLNLCGARGIPFWELTWESPVCLTLRAVGRDLPRLRQAAEDAGGSLHLCRSGGVPVFWRRLRRRYVLLAGAVLALVLMFGGNLVIWDFQVSGNDTVPTETILRALEDYGITVGSPGLHIDQETMRNHVLLVLPEVSWLAVNVRGCVAHVQVVERHRPPEAADRSTVTNIVARRAGLITKVEALEGQAMVLPGATVTEGQLLISGVEDTDTVGARILAGRGSVTARTWYTLSTVMPLTVAEKQYTGEEKQGYSLVFGTNRVKFFLNSSIGTGNYDKITERTQWSLFGLPLPVTFVKETFRFYETVPAEVSAAQAESRGEAILTDYLHTLVDPYGTVSSTLCTSRREGDGLLVTLTAECVEEIGRAVPIYTDPTEESGG